MGWDEGIDIGEGVLFIVIWVRVDVFVWVLFGGVVS